MKFFVGKTVSDMKSYWRNLYVIDCAVVFSNLIVFVVILPGHYWGEAQPEGLPATLVWKHIEARNIRRDTGNELEEVGGFLGA